MTEQSGPLGGTPESAAWFREALAELGHTQSSFAKWMTRHGDDRTPKNILRSVQRIAAGDARVSGEMRVVLAMLLQSHRKRTTKARQEPAEMAVSG